MRAPRGSDPELEPVERPRKKKAQDSKQLPSPLVYSKALFFHQHKSEIKGLILIRHEHLRFSGQDETNSPTRKRNLPAVFSDAWKRS